MNKRGPRPRVEEDRTALGIQRLRFLFIQLQCNPFMRFPVASSFIRPACPLHLAPDAAGLLLAHPGSAFAGPGLR